MNSRVSICLKLYRRLASAYPHEFRMLYGEDLDRSGEDAVPEIWRRYGAPGLVRLLADIALQLPLLYLREIRQDVRHAARMLAKSPGFTAVAALSLAIGIGMCCAVLSESRAITGAPPGVGDPRALVAGLSGVSYPYFERFRDRRQEWISATAFLGPVPFAVAVGGEKSAKAERFSGVLVSAEFFTTLGVTAAMGRFFGPATAKPGAPTEVVVSERFWRSRLASDPRAVGHPLRLNASMATIVGVGPKDFRGLWPANYPADLFVPAACAASFAPELSGDALHRPDRAIFRLALRLAEGVPSRQAEAALGALARNLDRENGLDRDADRKNKPIRLIPAGTAGLMRPEQRTVVNTLNVVLWALVLALVCANLANLLLARGNDRKREVAVRLSVGASRPRLVRQFLTESVLLSLMGGVGGIVLAYWITHAISSMAATAPISLDCRCEPDIRVLAFTMAVTLAAGVGFGLTPALSASRVDIGGALKEGVLTPLRGYRRFGLRNLFVVCQMAASLMLLLVTCYLATGFLNHARLNPDFPTANLSLISLDPARDGYTAGEIAALYAKLPGELSRVGELETASLAASAPTAMHIAAAEPNARVSIRPARGQGGQKSAAVLRDRIGQGYFATLGAPIIAGREFERRDREQGGTAILNQTAARQLFGGEDPIGRRICEGDATYAVVGITRDLQTGFLMAKSVPTLYLPLTAEWFRGRPADGVTILARGAPGRDALTAVRKKLESLHADLTLFNVRTMQEDLDHFNAFVAWQSGIYVALGLFALLLASIGLGGVTAYAVAQRRKEIGIRMALGARSRQVQGLVLREGTVLVAVGAVFGFGGAVGLARSLAAYNDAMARTFATRIDDPFMVIGMPLMLVGLAMLACYLPARRATAIGPMAALREE